MRHLTEHVRVAAVETMGYLQRDGDDERKFAGASSAIFNMLMNIYRFDNFSLSWFTSNDFGLDVSTNVSTLNGSHGGLVGWIQQGEADFFPPLLSTKLVSRGDPVLFGPHINHPLTMRIASHLIITFNNADLVRSMLCLSNTLLISLALSVLAFAMFISNFEPQVKKGRKAWQAFLMSVYYQFCLFVAQPILTSSRLASQCVLLCYAIAFMLFLMYWENMMTTDLLAPDTSLLIDSVDDLLANASIEVTLNEVLPEYKQLKDDDPDSKFGRIFNRIKANESTLDSWHNYTSGQRMVEQFVKRERVILVNEDTFSNLGWTACYCYGITNNWMSRHSYFELINAPIYNKQVSGEMREYFDYRSYQLTESGLFVHLWKNFVTNPTTYFEDESLMKIKGECFIKNLDDYISNQRFAKGTNDLSNTCLWGLWILLMAGLTISALVMIAEKRKRKAFVRKKMGKFSLRRHSKPISNL